MIKSERDWAVEFVTEYNTTVDKFDFHQSKICVHKIQNYKNIMHAA